MADINEVMRELKSINQKIDTNNRDTAQIKGWLIGDPDKPESPGVLTRLDRLESFQNFAKWAFTACGGAALTYIGQWVLAKFQGKP